VVNLYTEDSLKSYIQIYGEGPKGQLQLGFETKTYSKEDTTEFCRAEIMEFLSAMIYGYNFDYKIENKINNTKGFFNLENIVNLRKDDKNIRFTEVLEYENSLKIKCIYRLNDDQKIYHAGYQSLSSRSSAGESFGDIYGGWETRLKTYKEAIKNSILNAAKKNIKSRPLYVKR